MPLIAPPVPSPRFLAAPLRILPESLAHQPLEKTINLIFREPLEDGEFDFLEDAWVKLDITDMELEFFIGFDGEQLKLSGQRPSDVVFKGDSKAFATLASRTEDPDTLFFQRRLMIEGDTELGLALKNLLDSLDTEQLPPSLRQLVKLGEKLSGLVKRSRVH